MTNFDLVDSVRRFQRVLESSGITPELERLGVRSGDIVSIGDYELTWGEHDDFAQIPEELLHDSERRKR
jgi:hypothetical protein